MKALRSILFCFFVIALGSASSLSAQNANSAQNQVQVEMPQNVVVKILKGSQDYFYPHFGLNLGQLIQWHNQGSCTITPLLEKDTYRVQIQDCIVIISIADSF